MGTHTQNRPLISSASLAFLVFLALAFLLAFRPTSLDRLPDLRAAVSPPPPPVRIAHNILYWKPHKTGSTSAKLWMDALAAAANLRLKFFAPRAYLFQAPTDLATRAGDANCTIFLGHILTRDVHSRTHEASRGAVITTTRDAYNYLCSKYFHTSEGSYNTHIEGLEHRDTIEARLWWSRWLIYDRCETYRYYDGLQGCPAEPAALHARAEAIAERIDCVIDTEDPQPDADAICKVIGLEHCPEFGSSNTRISPEVGYEKLLDIKHIKKALDGPAAVIQILRDALLKRRCRLMTAPGKVYDSSSTMGNLPPAKWPTTNCVAQSA